MSSLKVKADSFLRIIAVNGRGDTVSTNAIKREDGEVTFSAGQGYEMRVAEIEEAEYLAITAPPEPPKEPEGDPDPEPEAE